MRTSPVTLALLMAASVVAASSPRPTLITVDDLPISMGSLHDSDDEREQITRRMLAVLAAHEIRAVGMVTWKNVRSERDVKLLEMWLEAGHELGNHTLSHLDYTVTDTAVFIADVEAARSKLAALLARHNQQLRFFRFPMLREGASEAKLKAMREYLAASGQSNLPVTLDNQDCSFERPWVAASVADDRAAMARVAEQYHESLHVAIRHQERISDRMFGRPVAQVLLLHGGEVGAAQWDRLFTWLTDTGHRFADADEVFADAALTTPHRYLGPRGPGLWDRLAHEQRERGAKTDIAEMLAIQQDAWNRGDLEVFVQSYSEDALFVSPTGLTRGRLKVLERYLRRYPDRQAMGVLSLEIIQVHTISGIETSLLGDSVPGRVHGASVVARWTLSRPGREDSEGLTLLVICHIDKRWQIVHDASM